MVVTATDGSFAAGMVTGGIHHHRHTGPRIPAAWPHQVGVIPSRAQYFQQRADADRVRAAFDEGGTAVPCQVLTGMGGVGKTQLAADYARSAWDTAGLDVLVWVTADSRSSVVAVYAQAGVELCRADPDDPEQAARTFLAWLAPKPRQRLCRWLIVLDDVADPSDLHGLWPPPSRHGRALVTTRRRDAAVAGDGRRLVQVGLFTETEAVDYLTTSLAAHARSEPSEQLSSLAAELGYLALGLAQAAAYLIDTGASAATYRRLLADEQATTLAELSPDALPDEQAVRLAAAWSLSITRADALRPTGLARPMLHLASLLDANGIPHDVLTGETTRVHLAAHRTNSSLRTGPGTTADTAPVSHLDAVRALRALDRLNLIDHRPGTPHQAVRVHQLIQRATRDTLTHEQQRQYARTAADALIAAWPDIQRDTALAQALRANTEALTRQAEDALHQPKAHAVLYRLGSSLGGSGQVFAAIDHFDRLAITTRSRMGADHPDTLAARHDLASWRGEAGDAAGAAAVFAELLEERTRVLGPDHPDTLITRRSLADQRGLTGDAAGAAAAYADLLKDSTRVLGPDHPDTLITRNNLAHWRGQTGDAAGAAAAYADLLKDSTRVLGPDHPHTLTARYQLAYYQGRAGDAAGAAAAHADLLEERTRVLGPDHPDTLTSRHLLAYYQGKAGDAAGAAAAYADLLRDRTRVLGPDHRQTLIASADLAFWRGEAGDAAGAAAAYADLLRDRTRVLGPDHRQTLIASASLAFWRGEAGDAAGAAAAYADLLRDRTRVLGP
ncbi:tetratricopeptide repeat protein, partial [Streptomyces sp. NPDC047868]|uniref:tetratricopeptide repeat protein n=1 Tax=Streptomyces sp. NPDC047868 TaxID=3155480 RepID=UPI00345646DD